MTPDLLDSPEPMTLQEERRISSCQGKKTFETWDTARDRAKLMGRREHERGSGIWFEPYRCKHCGKLHVGSRDKLTNHNPRTRRGRGKRKKGKQDE